MQVGVVSVLVRHRRVPVPVAVRLSRRDAIRMVVLVMDVVDVAMVVFERFVRVLVTMVFGQMQPEPDRHQDSGDDERYGDGFAEHCHCQQRADEGCGREIGA